MLGFCSGTCCGSFMRQFLRMCVRVGVAQGWDGSIVSRVDINSM